MSVNQQKMRIGVVGCGNISTTYLQNASLFNGIEVNACADLSFELAKCRASEFGIRALSVDALCADSEIDLVLNLTVPAAHYEVSIDALSAGKHVFTEKPLALNVAEGRKLLELAEARGLLIGSAPDTFLGAAGREARRLLDSDSIGQPVTGTAFMFGRGMEHWHPNPAFYYQPGGGPLFDMGPYYLAMLVNLLGPVERVQAMATQGQKERLITAAGALQNTKFKVDTPTTVQALLAFRAGAVVQFGTSWDIYRHSNACLEIHGTKGTIRLPDPDTFGGSVSLSDRGETWMEHDTKGAIFGAHNWPFDAPNRANYRMLGVAELAQASREDREPRASGRLMLHVLDVMESIQLASVHSSSVTIKTDVERPLSLNEVDAASLLS